MSELSTAVLLCSPYADERRYTHSRVDGIEIPGSARLIGRHAAAASLNPERFEKIEVAMPEAMVGNLAEMYKRVFVRCAAEFWNCHTVGAELTGQRDEMDIDMYGDVTNAVPVPGKIVTPDQIANGGLYGFFDHMHTHTFVGTQIPGRVLNGVDLRGPLCVSQITTLQGSYPGVIRPYGFDSDPQHRPFF